MSEEDYVQVVEEDYVQVVLDGAPAPAGGIWTYLVPPHLKGSLRVGQRVEVPFGGRVMEATVVGWGGPPGRGEARPVLGTVPQRVDLPEELVGLALRVAKLYQCSPAAGLRCVSPPALRVDERETVRLLVSGEELMARAGSLRSPRARRLAGVLAAAPRRRSFPLGELEDTWGEGAGSLRDTLRLMSRHGLVQVVRARRAASSPRGKAAPASAPAGGPRGGIPVPAAEGVRPAHPSARVPAGGPAETLVLWGGDPYGRAEAYLETVEEALARGQTAIVLAPSIEQVNRMAGWWRSRLGERLAVLHAGLTPARRQGAWLSLARGEARVALGTRSAVFAPVGDGDRALEVVVLEREHDEAYKQEEVPRYHAGRVAALRPARQVVLGSSTPRLETFFRAERGEYGLRQLPAPGRPPVTVVDVRLAAGGPRRGSLSGPLRAALARVVARRERAVLFLNRRGYAAALSCRECGQSLGCPRCRVSLVYHRPGWLHCHLCGFSRPVPDVCPLCGGRQLGLVGAGTQKVEQEVQQFLPGTPVLRLDSDVASCPDRVQELWEAFLARRPAVLVGTQMVAGGAQFPDLGLVAAVNADVGLHLPDFRAAERTFSLLYDLGEMAVDWGGEVMVQTHHPDHHAIRAARVHDYREFYREEIGSREELGYPPFSHLVRLIFAAPREEEARRAMEDLCAELPAGAGVEVLGPAPAPLSPLKGSFRWVALLKSREPEGAAVMLQEAMARSGMERRRGVRLTVDVDPYDML
ncbi:MAG: primosomal protein N' [Bacillota bacterium]|nr:primosomal protein N' [Bacillota bacterium]